MVTKRTFLTTAGLMLAISPAMAGSLVTVPKADYSTRPDAGTYLGNQVATYSFFSQTQHQRKITPLGDQLWLRVSGYHGKDLSAADGNLSVKLDRQEFLLGGDLLSLQQGDQEWTAGLMTGYAHAQTHAKYAGSSSKGLVNGYFVGAYSTWYQDNTHHTGAYIDSWMQYAWFDNSVTNQQAKESYDSKKVAVSIEVGYALRPFPVELVIEPQLQFIYSHFHTDSYRDATGVNVQRGETPERSSRAGIRWYSDRDDSITAFLATNWWHNSGSNAVYFNNTRIEAGSLSNLFEVKMGIQTPIDSPFQLWLEGGTMMGTNSYQDYSASVGLSYRW